MSIAFDWGKTLRHGEVAAVDAARADQHVGPEDVIWALFREACQVSKSYAGPPRLGYPGKSSLPEPPEEITAWQRMAAYLRGEVDEIPESDISAPRPTAAQISRADHVLAIWHGHALARKGDRKKLRKAVYALACGLPYRAIRDRTGIARASLYRAKDQAMADMWAAIKQNAGAV